MAFDLVQYFTAQIDNQKPELLSKLPRSERLEHIQEINTLTLGELIRQWRENDTKVYQEITHPDPLYIQEVSRHLTTSAENKSALPLFQLEELTSTIFSLQLHELKQLHDTGGLNLSSVRELLLGQIEHLSGQSDDWVWSTNQLIELKGSKPIQQEELSLEATMKEFNHMVNQSHTDTEHTASTPAIPAWSKVLEPAVAVIILWFLYSAACKMFV
ncbi:hypothetical protein [Acinetobacter tianfuensis]|uniref:Uncharacterized protein n=1 Tax=Acinetobacter tianfuensis TaxID=2419603 RepID=A0A3A8E7C2_9GAMM|nr:hypothetical protein [Acinetobacter tianfuensis]RKG30515.1 hypothetical protein D7V32_10815 [Acinetobacter tianfuensis]